MTEGDTYSIMRGGRRDEAGGRTGAPHAKIRETIHANTLIRLDKSRSTTTCEDL